MKKREKSFKISVNDSTQTKKAFNKFRNQLLKASGIKSTLPTSIKAYKKQTGLTYAEAEKAYWKEWNKEARRIYYNYARRARRKKEKYGEEIKTRVRLIQPENRGKKGTLETFTGYIKTIQNILNPNYYNKTLTKKEEALIKKPNVKSGFTSYGIKNATLKTFKGSSVKLAYNNFIYSLSQLNYSTALEEFLKMDLATFDKLLKNGLQQVELVYNYRYVRGEEEALLKILKDNGIQTNYDEDETGLEIE